MSVRNYLWFALVAFTCAASAQDVKVTYTTVAVPAKVALAELAQKSGMQIACSPSLDKEIVVLRLKDAPMSEVMKHLATVTSGAWKKEGEILYLAPDAGGRQIEANRVQKEFADQIAAFLKKQQDALASRKPPKETEEMPAMFGMFGGGNSAVLKLAIAIGANQLASVPTDGRVVFSTNPTPMQRSMPASANAIIGEFIADHNKMAAKVRQEEPAKVDNEEMAMFMELFGNRMQKPKPITSTPAKAIAIASRRGSFMGYTFELRLYDTQGKLMASGSTSISTGSLPFDPEEVMSEKPAPTNKGKEIKLSALSKELYEASDAFDSRRDAANLKLSKELLDALKDPVSRDPLSFAQSEALIAIAEQRNLQLVANVPDGVVSVYDFTEKGNITDESFLKEISGDDKAVVKESGGWMLVQPENPVDARATRADRGALRTLIAASISKGSVSLDDIAAYAVKNASPMDGASITSTYIMLFAPGVMTQGMMGMPNWDLVRLYGLLNPQQRQSLRSNGRIPFSQLDGGQRGQLSKMLFGPEENLMVETPAEANRPKQDPITEIMMSQIRRFAGGADADFRTEPTEIMPNGLPAGGYLQVDFTTEPVAQPQTMSTDLGRGVTLGPMELGMFKMFTEDPKLSQISGQMPTFDDLKVGSRSVYNFSIYVAPAVVQKGILHDDAIAQDAKVYKMANLPPDFQKKIDDMAAMMKNNPIWKMIGSMGSLGQRTPPP